MDELFNMLSSSARLDKSKRPKRQRTSLTSAVATASTTKAPDSNEEASRDRTGKRDTSEEKQEQVHRESIAAFRRSMFIKLSANHGAPDPIASFKELACPSWWNNDSLSFTNTYRTILKNIESGKWKEPTSIQMQAIPTIMAREDFIGCAPTGSGKSGAFILPALLLTSVSDVIFYGTSPTETSNVTKKSKKKKTASSPPSQQGHVRSVLLAPSRELAAQLHREVERLGIGKQGGLHSLLLERSNASNVISGSAGGKRGLDVLVSTPLRLVDAIEKGMSLSGVRLIVLDEADRLLDATDQKFQDARDAKEGQNKDETGDDNDEDDTPAQQSGSTRTKTFLAQMDVIFNALPATATRALFSATVTPSVRELSESILRNPVDVTVASGKTGGANTDIEQELTFVGREEGKLLAIRQLVARGELKPPVIVFVQSQERAQALFAELLYDGIHVDVIHAGRSRLARDTAVAKFRKGETWVLICTDVVSRGVDFRAVNMVINYDLPSSGITYVHRIGRTGRAGRKGKAITLFTEADFDNLRTIANVMKQSGCEVPEWMLTLKQTRTKKGAPERPRATIDTTPLYDKIKKRNRMQSIQKSKKQKTEHGSKQS
jgi:ATP-dependent RNA helicase DDX52/ROK1